MGVGVADVVSGDTGVPVSPTGAVEGVLEASARGALGEGIAETEIVCSELGIAAIGAARGKLRAASVSVAIRPTLAIRSSVLGCVVNSPPDPEKRCIAIRQ